MLNDCQKCTLYDYKYGACHFSLPHPRIKVNYNMTFTESILIIVLNNNEFTF